MGVPRRFFPHSVGLRDNLYSQRSVFSVDGFREPDLKWPCQTDRDFYAEN